MTKNNVKEIILFVAKSAIFLWIMRYLYSEVFSTIDFISLLLFAVLNLIPNAILSFIVMLFFSKLSLYLYIVFSYFTAKKLGLIKFIDKSPIWLVILILVVYEFMLTFYPSYNFDNENWILLFIHKYQLLLKEMFKDCILGQGFIYTFIAYKSTRFLVNKYPKLSFLKKFYFLKKFENIITFKNIITTIKNYFHKFINWWKKNFRWH